MKTTLISILFAGLLTLSACAPASTGIPAANSSESTVKLALTSPAFTDGDMIPEDYTCNGPDTSPALTWGEPPAGTKSFALHMIDIDAHSGPFVHWVIFNIPAASRGLPASVPTTAQLADGSLQGLNNAAMMGYAGPCPPEGTQRYVFTLYALDITLNLSTDANDDTMVKWMQGHILAQGQLTGKFAK